MLYQYGNPANSGAHYAGTGPELLEDLRPHPLRRGLGTTGTLMGVRAVPAREGPASLRSSQAEPRYDDPDYGLRNLDRIRPELYDADVLSSRYSVGSADALPPHRNSSRSRHLRWDLHRLRPARRARLPARGPGGERADIAFIVADGAGSTCPPARRGHPTRPSDRLEGQLWA